MSRYLVITADAHAGVPLPEYREWVEPRYRQAFDDRIEADLAFRHQEKDLFLDKNFEAGWKQGRVPEGIASHAAEAVVKGDRDVRCIAAASIIAKVRTEQRRRVVLRARGGGGGGGRGVGRRIAGSHRRCVSCVQHYACGDALR